MRILLLNQCFHPDVVATAQQLTQLAVGLAEKGHQVTVIASDRGYDNPGLRFPRRETWQGITIIRIPAFALGKETKWRRFVNFASFLVLCSLRLLLLPRFDVVVALTSPPLISVLGSLFVQLKGGKFFFWVMDLNPDEAIAAGWLQEDSLTAKMLGRLLEFSLDRSRKVIVLDRFMKQRLLAKGVREEQIVVLPPWSHDGSISYDEAGRRAFRARHNLNGDFVVMYSGNHSPCHPLDTLLEAALSLSSQKGIAFCFVGGGSEQAKVKAFATRHNLTNLKCLPYQPLAELAGSLSAADLHTIVMGEGFAGIVHPCKVYNIIKVGTPFLYIGPRESHISDIAAKETNGYQVYTANHGEAEKVADYILNAAALRFAGRVGSHPATSGEFSRNVLLPRLIQTLTED